MSKLACIHCKTTFTTETILAAHQKTAKYCLKIQGKGESVQKNCAYCRKNFANETTLSRHLNVCTERKIAELEEAHQSTVAKLEDKVKTLATRNRILTKKLKIADDSIATFNGRILELKDAKPQTVNTTNIINPKLINVVTENIRPLTVETVREDVHKYGYNEFLRGYSGLKEFVTSIISLTTPDGDGNERNYVCTDASRNSFHRLIESKEWTSDGGARFIHSILDELRDVSNDHFRTLVEEERRAVSDEFEREQVDATKTVVKPVFYGITGSTEGTHRTKLFKALRNEIREAASV